MVMAKDNDKKSNVPVFLNAQTKKNMELIRNFAKMVSNEKTTSFEETKGSAKSILLQVDDATKGIMQEIQSGITDDILGTISEHGRLINELKEKIDETYEVHKTNNKLLKSIEKQLKKMQDADE
ncbi:hypothetical protein ACER0A_011100 [Haloimpatiens sp. FM7315]|uniref:hypothetical protein n=1 Tax=Haloimpatiens sp. FM7315 TaxID=3298609 RepID=UPI00370C4195